MRKYRGETIPDLTCMDMCAGGQTKAYELRMGSSRQDMLNHMRGIINYMDMRSEGKADSACYIRYYLCSIWNAGRHMRVELSKYLA